MAATPAVFDIRRALLLGASRHPAVIRDVPSVRSQVRHPV
jgi:hypothetical protein